MTRANLWIAALLCTAAAFILSGCVGGGCASGLPSTEAKEQTQETEEGMTVEVEAEYHLMTQDEAKARMDSGDDLIILDVRTREEYDAGHIEGAILIPNEEIGSDMPEELPDKNAEILIYCRSGNRSAQAAKKLVKQGYTAVYDFGGINSWTYGTVTE